MPVSKKESDGIALKLASQTKELSVQEYKEAEMPGVVCVLCSKD